MAKIITVKETYRGREHLYTGTVEELARMTFNYKLDCGHSWNSKINNHPRTANSLITNLRKAEDEVRGGCFDRASYELVG